MPNLFFLLGPNTGQDHNSVVFMIESQMHYVADAIATCDKFGAQAMAPTRVAQKERDREQEPEPEPDLSADATPDDLFLKDDKRERPKRSRNKRHGRPR